MTVEPRTRPAVPGNAGDFHSAEEKPVRGSNKKTAGHELQKRGHSYSNKKGGGITKADGYEILKRRAHVPETEVQVTKTCLVDFIACVVGDETVRAAPHFPGPPVDHLSLALGVKGLVQCPEAVAV